MRARGCLIEEDHQLIDGLGVAPYNQRWAAARHGEEEKGGEAMADTARAAVKEKKQTKADRSGGSSLLATRFLLESEESRDGGMGKWR